MNEKEITEIENAAVTNFAEMLCDYVSGLDEGEGIGREDIIDHLYEYINRIGDVYILISENEVL